MNVCVWLGALLSALLWTCSASADAAFDLDLRCQQRERQWLLAARHEPPTLMLFDAQMRLVKAWPVASRDGQRSSRVASIVDAHTRRSFVVSLRDIAELWEISYDPTAEDFYDGLVHDFRFGEGVATRGFLNPRRIALTDPLEALQYDPISTEVSGVARASAHGGPTLQRINLDVRRRVAMQPLADVPAPRTAACGG